MPSAETTDVPDQHLAPDLRSLVHRARALHDEVRRVEEAIVDLVGRTGIYGLDGEACPQTLRIHEQLNAHGFALNSWWAITKPEWNCPACKRGKTAIARLDRHGRLMGKLVEHHDHMQDVLERLFIYASQARDSVVADQRAQSFVKRAAPLLSAYDRTVICIDCNNVDARAKKLVAAPADFSFSPAEIATFVVARSNQDHEIDVQRANAAWDAARATFGLRMKVAKRLAEIAASDEHWHQEAPLEARPDRIEALARMSAALYGMSFVPENRLYATGQKRPDPTVWRRRTAPSPTRPPTQNEVDHVARVAYPQFWQLVAEDWSCPCCSRKKRELVRPNKQNQWCFNIQTRYFASPNGRVNVMVCRDCQMVAGHLDAEAGSRAGVGVSLDEVRRVIVARPHALHSVNDQEAQCVVADVRSRWAEHWTEME